MRTRWNLIVVIEQKVDSKAFVIPILTAFAFCNLVVRIGIANALESTFCSITTIDIEFYLVCMVF